MNADAEAIADNISAVVNFILYYCARSVLSGVIVQKIQYDTVNPY